MEKILEIKNLNIVFETHAGTVYAIQDISFDLKAGETLAIVGESGSGKLVTSKAIMQLLAENGKITHGQILYKKNNGEIIDITKLKDSQMHHIRGREIAMVFQDPMTSLNPTMTIGKQIMEPLIKHRVVETKKNIIKESEESVKSLTEYISRLEKLPNNEEKNQKISVLKQELKQIQKNKIVKLTKYEALQKERLNKINELKVKKKRLLDKYRSCQENKKAIKWELMQIKQELKTLSYNDLQRKAMELINLVGIDHPEKRMKQYPHQFSGGMRQRIVIAIALACNPKILICDEPTTALDVTIQAQIIELIKALQKKTGCAVIFISHDLGVVANIADRVAVMYAGKICEIGTSREIFYEPRHPYTWGLLASKPDREDIKERLYSIPGTPPNLLNPPKGDAFALRSDYAMEIDFIEAPPLFKISATHYAATWLLHKDAPKVEMPSIIRKRYAKKGVVKRDE